MSYILYVPANFVPDSGAMVLALHPRVGSAAGMESLTRLNEKANQAGFAVVYPQTGGTFWGWYFNGLDHIPALRSVITSVQAKIRANPKRIYATGYSDGAEMAHRVGVELSDLVAAIAPVDGVLYEKWSVGTVPNAKSSVSVLMLHGDMPPGASFFVCGYGMVPSQDEIFDYWTGPQANSCSKFNSPAGICSNGAVQLSGKNAKDYKGSAEVQFYPLLNGTHGWHNTPGNWSIPLGTYPAGFTPYNPNFNATTGFTTNDIIWNFFNSHPKP